MNSDFRGLIYSFNQKSTNEFIREYIKGSEDIIT